MTFADAYANARFICYNPRMKTPREENVKEIDVMASRFVSYLIPFTNPDDFEEQYARVKKLSPKADHYPYAYIVGDIQKSGDDGEPGGAAGRNYLHMMEEKGIDRALIVTARYFGGTKLGLPRLRRTFLEAATLAIDTGKYFEITMRKLFKVELSYREYEILKHYAPKDGIRFEKTLFGEKVEATLSGNDTIPSFLKKLAILGECSPLGEAETLEEI